MENHDNQNDERWERVQNALMEIRDGQQSIYEYLRGIELCECKDDEQPKADLGSFMSSNEIETVDLEQVSKDENKPSHIPPGIKEVLKKYNVELLEDCCESHGTTYDGVKIGNFGSNVFSV